MAVKAKKNHERNHPQKESCGSCLISCERIGKVDHGKAHLKAEKLASCLNGHKGEINGKAQGNAHEGLSKNHKGKGEGMKTYGGGIDREPWPESHGKDKGDCCFDRDRYIICVENGQHEKHNADAHKGEKKVKEERGIMGENIHGKSRIEKISRRGGSALSVKDPK